MGWIDLGQAWGSGDEDVPTEAEYQAQQEARGIRFLMPRQLALPAPSQERICTLCGGVMPENQRGYRCASCRGRIARAQRRLTEKARA